MWCRQYCLERFDWRVDWRVASPSRREIYLLGACFVPERVPKHPLCPLVVARQVEWKMRQVAVPCSSGLLFYTCSIDVQMSIVLRATGAGADQQENTFHMPAMRTRSIGTDVVAPSGAM